SSPGGPNGGSYSGHAARRYRRVRQSRCSICKTATSIHSIVASGHARITVPLNYLARRLLNSALLLFGASVLTFLLVDLAPGEFFDEIRVNPRISTSTIANLRSEYGLDLPFPIRYWRWLRSVAKGDGGFSFAYDSPAAPILRRRAQNTL